jgi:hypothetical protein
MRMKNGEWLIVIVAMGLLAYSLTGIAVNGFQMHLIYPVMLAAVNLAAFWMIRK